MSDDRVEIDAADIVIPAVGENTEWRYAFFEDGRAYEMVDGEWRPLTTEDGTLLIGTPVVHIDPANDSITVELVEEEPMNPTYAWQITVRQAGSANTKTAYVLGKTVEDVLDAANRLGVRIAAVTDIERLFEVDVLALPDGGFHVLGSKWG